MAERVGEDLHPRRDDLRWHRRPPARRASQSAEPSPQLRGDVGGSRRHDAELVGDERHVALAVEPIDFVVEQLGEIGELAAITACLVVRVPEHLVAITRPRAVEPVDGLAEIGESGVLQDVSQGDVVHGLNPNDRGQAVPDTIPDIVAAPCPRSPSRRTSGIVSG